MDKTLQLLYVCELQVEFSVGVFVVAECGNLSKINTRAMLGG